MSQFISYAQNFEDVMLWRALKHIEHGFYVDVGANDPKYDSVTQAFYERGWRGINIEPSRPWYEKLCAERVNDINLSYAVGAEEGEFTFYEAPDTGLSTLLPDFAENLKAAGRTVVENKVRVVPLHKVFEEYVQGPVHFLKVDVEGSEKAVIEGLDLSKWRPWIILTEISTTVESREYEESLKTLIVSSGYTFIYYDGLNRFYLANEHSELREAFTLPPNIFDHFILFSQARANSELDMYRRVLAHTQYEAETKRQALEQALANAQAETSSLYAKLDKALGNIKFLREESERIRAERDQLQSALNASQAESENLRHQYTNILYSRSYRITAPMRAFFLLVQKVKDRVKGILRRSGGTGAVVINAAEPLPQAPGPAPMTDDQKYYYELFTQAQEKGNSAKDSGAA